MRKLIQFCLLAPLAAQAQIYRCDTAEGVTFSDESCGDTAALVTLGDESAGLGGGPGEDVRAYLAEKRKERADQRDKVKLQPNSTPVVISNPQQTSQDGGYWPRVIRPVNSSRPVHRPRPDQPKPSPPPSGDDNRSHVKRPLPDDDGG